MLTTLIIKNFKSIVDLTLELGRFNVLIGENGCGKTNLLEALGMAAAAGSGRLGLEDLVQRGIRVARPSLMTSAFDGVEQDGVVEILLERDGDKLKDEVVLPFRLSAESGEWIDHTLIEQLKQHSQSDPESDGASLPPDFLGKVNLLSKELRQFFANHPRNLTSHLTHYAIFCAETLALRGLQVQSRKTPLGLYGEGLDVAIAQMPRELREELVEEARLVSWLEDIDLDRQGARKLEGYKLGRSVSDLYFYDRFLSEDNRLFSAENANEGILHVLFYLALFLHPGAPRLFAVDNIETALNPHLLRHLVKTLTRLAKTQDRQALVTTHNPATLDGLNLHDDDQRLFVLYRDDEGHTQARRIRLKPEGEEGGVKLKLSELWMRGMLGGIPTHF